MAMLLYHGMVRGLAMIVATSPATSMPHAGCATERQVEADPALVKLLANMVLRIQAEVQHVY